jgi:hypothetical protein
MKKPSKQPSTETRIAAARAVFEKYASAIAEIEDILGLDAGELIEQWIRTGLDGDGGEVCVVSGDLHEGDFILRPRHYGKAARIQTILDQMLKAA